MWVPFGRLAAPVLGMLFYQESTASVHEVGEVCPETLVRLQNSSSEMNGILRTFSFAAMYLDVWSFGSKRQAGWLAYPHSSTICGMTGFGEVRMPF